MSERTSLDDVRSKALETAYRLDAYSSYGGKRKTAIRALARRCPGRERDELAELLGAALDVQAAAGPWLEAHESALLAATAAGQELDGASFHEAHPDWPRDALDALLSINFLYFFLK